MPASRPNIVIFNPDQWRGDVMRHLGNPAAVTPNLDALAATEGVSFRNAFAQATVCTPSRCSFMTGWYPHTRGHRTMHYMLRERDNEPNLLRLLKDNGYFVWWGGKNDLVAGQEGYEEHAHASFRPSPADFERWGYQRQPGSHGGDLSWRGAPDGDTLSRARAPARQAAGGRGRRARGARPAHGTDRLHRHGLRAGGDRPGVLALRTFPDAALFADAAATHRDAVFCEGGRLADEAQASERESDAADTGLYAPRLQLQLSEGSPLPRCGPCQYARYSLRTTPCIDAHGEL